MADKILCFSLNGFSLAVEPDQIEKILINKHPTKDTFVLETGVEVKSLKSYIPLPEKEESLSGNIFFVKDQKDFYGFTIDRITGYLKLRGAEKIGSENGGSAIKYFVRNEGRTIPVLDLRYITNNAESVNTSDIEEIVNFSTSLEEGGRDTGGEDVFQDVSEDDVFKSIEEEINKTKQTHFADNIIESEKKGIVLPLIVNIVIITVVSLGIVYYLLSGRGKEQEQIIGKTISGVEAEVIREIRRKSEEEVRAQKEKLENARIRLESLQQERDYFLQNQEEILKQKEMELNEAFQRSLEEARKRIAESGVYNADEAYEKERERLYREFMASREGARRDIDELKRNYERELSSKEAEIQNEVNTYSRQLNNMEQKLQEEQAKLKEAEEQVQSIAMQQQEYLTFRKQLSSIYNKALGYFSRKDYPGGIKELNTLLPVISKARRRGIGDEAGLKVEEDLVKNILYLADREQNRIDLNQIGRETFEAAQALEREGQLEEALSKYFTVYTLGSDTNYKTRAMNRAEIIMDRIYENRTESERAKMEQQADAVFNKAMEYKSEGKYDRALQSLEDVLTRYPATTKSKMSLDEVIAINKRIELLRREEDKLKLNQQASQVMKKADNSYQDGFYSDALDRYEDVVRDYKDSDYIEEALAQIRDINSEMRGVKITPSFSRKKGEISTGVIVQVFPGNSLLLNLGSDDDVKKGDVLQVFRTEEDGVEFIGSLKIYEIHPKTSKGRIMYFEKQVKIGDIVSL